MATLPRVADRLVTVLADRVVFRARAFVERVGRVGRRQQHGAVRVAYASAATASVHFVLSRARPRRRPRQFLFRRPRARYTLRSLGGEKSTRMVLMRPTRKNVPLRFDAGMLYGLIREERSRNSNWEPRLDEDKCPDLYYGVFYGSHAGKMACKYEVHSGAKVLSRAAAPADRRRPARFFSPEPPFFESTTRLRSAVPGDHNLRHPRQRPPRSDRRRAVPARPKRPTSGSERERAGSARARASTGEAPDLRRELLERKNAAKGGAAPASDPTRDTFLRFSRSIIDRP